MVWDGTVKFFFLYIWIYEINYAFLFKEKMDMLNDSRFIITKSIIMYNAEIFWKLVWLSGSAIKFKVIGYHNFGKIIVNYNEIVSVSVNKISLEELF